MIMKLWVELVQRYSKLPIVTRFPSSTPMPGVPIERTGRRIHNVRRRLGPEIITQVVADYEAGQSTPVLTEKYHLAKGTVLKILDNHGITTRHQKMTDTETTEAVQLYQQGWSLARVGKHFDRNPSTIQGVLRRAGVERRKRWEQTNIIGNPATSEHMTVRQRRTGSPANWALHVDG
jgi:hypothetical protein